MKTSAPRVENCQAETRKQIRDAAAKICAAMDAEVMDVAANFVEWWTNQQAAHYRQVANGESNPSPLPSAQPRHQRSDERVYA